MRDFKPAILDNVIYVSGLSAAHRGNAGVRVVHFSPLSLAYSYACRLSFYWTCQGHFCSHGDRVASLVVLVGTTGGGGGASTVETVLPSIP